MTTRSQDAVRLVELVEQKLGLRIELATAMAVLDKRAMRTIVERIQTDPLALKLLAQELTVGETYFYRHVEQLDAFRDVALPARLSSNTGLVRVLSAGCSTGEEPYTLAMIARETQPGAFERVKISGFDLNEASLKKAEHAHYTRWSLRSVPPEREKRWFQPEGSAFVVVPAIRNAVAFTRANLTDPLALPPNTYDVVFCRNVLIYFSPAQIATAIARLAGSLVTGGYLFLGHAEAVRELPAGTTLCETNGTFYYRKGAATAVTAGYDTRPTDASWFSSIHEAADRVKSLALRAETEHAAFDLAAALAAVRAELAREDYVGALRGLDALPPAHAAEPDAQLLRAIALTESGDSERAREVAATLLDVPRCAASGSYLLAVCCESVGDLAGAARHAMRATEIEPAMAMAHLRLALIARRRGEREQAKDELVRAIDTLKTEPAERLALHAGGLGRDALVRLARAELAAIEAGR